MDKFEKPSMSFLSEETKENKTFSEMAPSNFNGVRAPYVESDKTALIIDELGYAFNSMNFEENKKEWEKCHLQTTVEQNFTVQQFKTELSKYDYICIRCHGCFDKSIKPNFAESMIETTEKFGHDMEKYILNLSNGRVGAFYSSTAGSYILKPSFFEYYYRNNKLNGKIVWLGCCYGFKNEKLVRAFSKCGAKTVIGATESVDSLYGTRMCDAFVYYLLCGDDTDIALANAKNDVGEHDNNTPPAEFKKYVDSRAMIVYLFTLNEEGKKALTEVSETTEIKKGSISGKVTDESGDPIKNVEVTAMVTLSDTIANKKAKTDNDGYYKIECNLGNYRIKITADGYEEYNSDEVVNVEEEFDTLIDTIKLKKIKKEYTETELKEKVLAESGGNIGSWVYEDFDGNGTKEAYAVIIGNYDSITECDHLEDIYFINGNGEITKMPGDFWGELYYSKTKEYEYFVCQGKGFFAVDSGNGGSGWQTLLYSVKDGSPYELNISRAIQGFNERDGIYYTTENNFDSGFHEYPEVELIYNSDTQQFTKGQRIEEKSSIEATEIRWQDIYASYLCNAEYTSLSTGFDGQYITSDQAKFHFVYLDNAEIPELLITSGYSVHIITIVDGKAKVVTDENGNDNFSWYGNFYYRDYTGYFINDYERSGTYLTPVYQLDNGKANLQINIEYDEFYSNGNIQKKFLIDNNEVSEQEYIHNCENWNLSTYYYTCSSDNWQCLDLNQYGLAVTNENIKSYIENNPN